MAETISTRFYVQTVPASDTWLDITHDVLLRNCKYRKGIFSSDPLERVASVGTLTMTLRNDGVTGIEHRFTPGHANCTPGFAVRCKVKVVTTWLGITKTQWMGWIPPDGITQIRNGPTAKFAQVTAFDWMYFALNNPVTMAVIGSDETFGEAGAYLAGLLAAQPSRIDQTGYVETFENTNDTVVENTTVYKELDKAAKSELGYVLVRYEPRSGANDILTFEGRTHRDTIRRFDSVPASTDDSPMILTEDSAYYLTDEDGNPIVADTATPFTTLPGIQDYHIVNGANYANRWLGKTYPRKVGTTAVIFRLNEPIQLDAGEKRENLRVRYIVADGYRSITAQTVSLTSYAMNSKEDGTGTDLTTSLTITGTYGSGDAVLSLENTGDVEGFVTTLEISGDPIYIGDTVSQVVDIASDDDTLYGQIECTLDQKYQSDPTRTYDQISLLAVRYSQRINTIEDVTFCANGSAILASVYTLTDLSARLPFAVSDYGIAEDYFVQGIETWFESNMTWVKFYLKPARIDTYKFWRIGETGYSELGLTSTLGIDQ